MHALYLEVNISLAVQFSYSLPLKMAVHIWKYAEICRNCLLVTSHACPLYLMASMFWPDDNWSIQCADLKWVIIWGPSFSIWHQCCLCSCMYIVNMAQYRCVSSDRYMLWASSDSISYIGRQLVWKKHIKSATYRFILLHGSLPLVQTFCEQYVITALTCMKVIQLVAHNSFIMKV